MNGLALAFIREVIKMGIAWGQANNGAHSVEVERALDDLTIRARDTAMDAEDNIEFFDERIKKDGETSEENTDGRV